MFNADCWERIGRAFLAGVVSTATALHLFADGWDITELESHWQPLLVGGIYAVVTLFKAQAGLGRGDDPTTGSWKGITQKTE